MKHTRLDQMQFLRVLAFLNIYMLHAGHWDIFGYPSWFGAISAVSFFFMLSGFLTGYHFRADSARYGVKEYKQYMLRKISRFYPLYFVTTLFAVVFSSIPQDMASGYPDRILPPVIQLIKNLLCIQSWFPDGFLSYNGPCWFSSTLLFLTALNIPFFLLLQKVYRSRKKNALLCGMLLLLFAGVYVYSYATRDGSLQFLHYILPLSRIGVYLGSIVLGALLRPCVDRFRHRAGSAAVFTALEAGALILWFASLFFPGAAWMEWNAAWILPNAVVLIVFSFGNGLLSRLFSLKPLVRLGDVTFECYLIHSLIIPVYSKFNKFDLSYTLGCLFSLALCLLLTYLIALFIHRPEKKQTSNTGV